MISAEVLLRSLIGEPLATVRECSNTIVGVTDDAAIVETSRSPQGRPVPIDWVDHVLDRIGAGEQVSIEPGSVGDRSAFLGAVLRTLPMVDVTDGSPPTAHLEPDYVVRPDVLAELETRLRMYADLVAQGGPGGAAPATLRDLGIYGGQSGVWNDVTRTRGIGEADSVTVGALHTGGTIPTNSQTRRCFITTPRPNARPVVINRRSRRQRQQGGCDLGSVPSAR